MNEQAIKEEIQMLRKHLSVVKKYYKPITLQYYIADNVNWYLGLPQWLRW